MSARQSKIAKETRKHAVPQECPDCKADLSDPSVPESHRLFRHMFSLALSDGPDWLCPVCGHRWRRR